MKFYVIASEKIPIKRIELGLLTECQYTIEEILDYFQHEQPMKVFQSLEDARLYAKATRDERKNSMFTVSEIQAYPVYRVQLPNNIKLVNYPIANDHVPYFLNARLGDKLKLDKGNCCLPPYHLVPVPKDIKILSYCDFFQEKLNKLPDSDTIVPRYYCITS